MPKLTTREPNFKTRFGLQLREIITNHPILLSIFKEKSKSLDKRVTDKNIIEAIMADYDYLEGIKYKSVILPYSTTLQVKLRNLIKE